MPTVACKPAYRSACETASARGSACSRRALNSINPSSACITGAYARRLAIGPSWPYPLIEQYTTAGLRARTAS